MLSNTPFSKLLPLCKTGVVEGTMLIHIIDGNVHYRSVANKCLINSTLVIPMHKYSLIPGPFHEVTRLSIDFSGSMYNWECAWCSINATDCRVF